MVLKIGPVPEARDQSKEFFSLESGARIPQKLIKKNFTQNRNNIFKHIYQFYFVSLLCNTLLKYFITNAGVLGMDIICHNIVIYKGTISILVLLKDFFNQHLYLVHSAYML